MPTFWSGQTMPRRPWRRSGHGHADLGSSRARSAASVVRDDMAVEGSVSGGCVEGAVIDAALDAIGNGTGTRLDFGVADARAWGSGCRAAARSRCR